MDRNTAGNRESGNAAVIYIRKGDNLDKQKNSKGRGAFMGLPNLSFGKAKDNASVPGRDI